MCQAGRRDPRRGQARCGSGPMGRGQRKKGARRSNGTARRRGPRARVQSPSRPTRPAQGQPDTSSILTGTRAPLRPPRRRPSAGATGERRAAPSCASGRVRRPGRRWTPVPMQQSPLRHSWRGEGVCSVAGRCVCGARSGPGNRGVKQRSAPLPSGTRLFLFFDFHPQKTAKMVRRRGAKPFRATPIMFAVSPALAVRELEPLFSFSGPPRARETEQSRRRRRSRSPTSLDAGLSPRHAGRTGTPRHPSGVTHFSGSPLAVA